MNLKIGTLFSGIGAFEHALKKKGVGHEVLFACDNGERYIDIEEGKLKEMVADKNGSLPEIENLYKLTGKENHVEKTYMLNYADELTGKFYQDVRFLDGRWHDSVDILVGGSPCQSFSTYGRKAGLEDTRGTLFYEFARVVKENNPKCFIYENVRGMMTHDKGNTWKVALEVFDSLGYKVNWKVINAVDHNLPQLRKRVFVVGFRPDVNSDNFTFPESRKLTKKVSDYLSELRQDNMYYLTKKGFEWVTTRSKNKNRSNYNSEIMKCQTATQQDNWVGEFVLHKSDNGLDEDKRIYCGEMAGLDGLYCVRKLIPDEAVRLMGFDTNIFQFPNDVKRNLKYRMSGNSIAVNVMEDIYDEINKIIQ